MREASELVIFPEVLLMVMVFEIVDWNGMGGKESTGVVAAYLYTQSEQEYFL